MRAEEALSHSEIGTSIYEPISTSNLQSALKGIHGFNATLYDCLENIIPFCHRILSSSVLAHDYMLKQT